MTQSDLETSISILLGEKTDQAMRAAGSALPERAKIAAEDAFKLQLHHSGPIVARVRKALLM